MMTLLSTMPHVCLRRRVTASDAAHARRSASTFCLRVRDPSRFIHDVIHYPIAKNAKSLRMAPDACADASVPVGKSADAVLDVQDTEVPL